MKIYTRKGDRGETGLLGGRKVSKSDPRIEAYGTVDELNSILGIVCASTAHADLKDLLTEIQNKLFEVGADLATPLSVTHAGIRRISPEDARPLEDQIDILEKELDPLKTFILPGGSVTAAGLHHARTVCRRAERSVVALRAREEVGEGLIVYLNRLSDLLFVLARHENKRAGTTELPWKR